MAGEEGTRHFLAAWRIVDRPQFKATASLAKIHLGKPHPAPVLRRSKLPLSDVKPLADLYRCPALEFQHEVVFCCSGGNMLTCLFVDPRLLHREKDFQSLLVTFGVPE
ncbi:hypothetical protein N657DRAFT_257976 [Parathielavia appendiculata]|uniref:Uncharacterized protein n=1 Tax=Parathielavia appendiculata TaxID=2587402 RepID=A0AAN6TRG4_9PEZI|nr:hypothetical protein N657DRAFT_257976 [Parathielavia appendiculata]